LKHKENLSITTFGPLTNLAVAFHYEYKVKDIGAVSLLGGQYTGVGNVVGSYSAEANFHFDPHATHIIIHVDIHLMEELLTQCVCHPDIKSSLNRLEVKVTHCRKITLCRLVQKGPSAAPQSLQVRLPGPSFSYLPRHHPQNPKKVL
jgi:inosine-uridine nucleoside N-ribohydrolase